MRPEGDRDYCPCAQARRTDPKVAQRRAGRAALSRPGAAGAAGTAGPCGARRGPAPRPIVGPFLPRTPGCAAAPRSHGPASPGAAPGTGKGRSRCPAEATPPRPPGLSGCCSRRPRPSTPRPHEKLRLGQEPVPSASRCSGQGYRLLLARPRCCSRRRRRLSPAARRPPRPAAPPHWLRAGRWAWPRRDRPEPALPAGDGREENGARSSPLFDWSHRDRWACQLAGVSRDWPTDGVRGAWPSLGPPPPP